MRVCVCVCVYVCVCVGVCMLRMYCCCLVCGRYSVCCLTLVFLKTIKEQEGPVIHIKIVPFVLMRVNVCDYPL